MAVTKEVALRQMAQERMKRENERVAQEAQQTVTTEVTKMSSQEIVELVTANPVMVLTAPETFEPFYESIKAEVMEHMPDLATEKGRKAIRSLAYKVVQTRTAIDNAGKELNAERRKMIDVVDESRRKIKARLEALEELARRPLTEWEKKEEQRKANIRLEILFIEGLGNGKIHGNPASFEELFKELNGLVIGDTFGEFEAEAGAAKMVAEQKLKLAYEAHQKSEADRLELEKLRAEKAERDRLERIAETEDQQAKELLTYIRQVRMGFIGGQLQPFGILLRELEIKIEKEDVVERHQEAIETARLEAHAFLTRQMEEQNRKAEAAAEEEKALNEKRAADRIAAAEKAAAENAARQERERLQKAHNAEMDRLRQEKEASDRKAWEEARERERVAQEEARRKAEEAAREKDKVHRKKVVAEVIAAMAGVLPDMAGLSQPIKKSVSDAIVSAIVNNKIPHTTIKF